jgi:hypothetical protein
MTPQYGLIRRVMPIRQHLATRPFLPQHDGASRIVAHDVERVLADIDADHGDHGIGCLRHGVLLVFGAPCQLRWLARQEPGRTIPLAEVVRFLKTTGNPERLCLLTYPV